MLDIVIFVPLHQHPGGGDAGFAALLEEAVKEVGDLPVNVYKVTDDKLKASLKEDLHFYQDFKTLGITPHLLFIGPTISKRMTNTDEMILMDPIKTKVAILGEYNLSADLIARYQAERYYLERKGYHVHFLRPGLGKCHMGIFQNPSLHASSLSSTADFFKPIPTDSKVWVEYHSCGINDRLFLLLKAHCQDKSPTANHTIILLGAHGFSHSKMESIFSTSRAGFVKTQADKLSRLFSNITYIDHDKSDRSFSKKGSGQADLLIIAKNAIPHSDYLYLLKERSGFVVGVTGDQSFGEALMLGKLILYEDDIVWKNDLIAEYRRYIEREAKTTFGLKSEEYRFIADWFKCCLPHPTGYQIRSSDKILALGKALPRLEGTLKPFIISTHQQILEQHDLTQNLKAFVQDILKADIKKEMKSTSSLSATK